MGRGGEGGGGRRGVLMKIAAREKYSDCLFFVLFLHSQTN